MQHIAVHKKDLSMFKLIAQWFARYFGPAFELLGQLPPSALNRITAPF